MYPNFLFLIYVCSKNVFQIRREGEEENERAIWLQSVHCYGKPSSHADGKAQTETSSEVIQKQTQNK
mgnify:CR=1 FL=1